MASHKSHCKLNPNHRTYENARSWSDGLTAETNEIVKNIGLKIKEGYASGRLKNSTKGKSLSEEIKEKISISRKKYYNENPDKLPYRLYHSSKQSYIEITFEKYLKEYNIEGWVYNYKFGRYNFDFAFPEWKLDVELDGGTHNLERVKLIDKERDEYTISQGWKVIRFKASEIRENVYDCINTVLKEISYPKLIEIPQEFLNKKLEKQLKEKAKEEIKIAKQTIAIENKRLKKEAKIKQALEPKKKRVITKKKESKDHEYLIIINKIIEINGNKYGIIQLIADELNLSHTTIRRICKRNNIDVFKRK